MSTTSRDIANLAVANELRSTEIEIRAGASMIRDVNTPENVRTYGFVLASPQFQAWLAAPGSAALGIVGSGGSGKTIVSGLIYQGLRSDLPAGDVCVFYHCSPLQDAGPAAILKAMIWAIFDQRPDVTLLPSSAAVRDKNGHDDDKHWGSKIRDANDRIPALWNLFAALARKLGATVWLVLDSVHDSSDAAQGLLAQLVRASRRTSMTVKIAATSRTPQRFADAGIDWLAYTAADLRPGVEAYARARLAELDGVRSGKLDGDRLLPAAVAAAGRAGGGHFWARAVLSQLQHKRSTEAALRSLDRLADPAQLGDRLISRLTRDSSGDEGEDRRQRAAFALCVYGAVVQSPATCSVADIQAAIAPRYPGATQEEIREVLDSRLQGLFAAANGDYVRVTSGIRACQGSTVEGLRVRAEAVERQAREEAVARQSFEEATAAAPQFLARAEIAELERRNRSRARLALLTMVLCILGGLMLKLTL